VRVFLYYIGKARDTHANALAAEFVKRSSRYADCQMREIKPQKFDFQRKHARARKIFLDSEGRSIDSAQFARIFDRAQREGQDLVFLVGGHDGLPLATKSQANFLLSLSPLTLPHELARAVLAEQIYRAFTTLNGHPYPR
ncbi:MAG: 23S rRNA (pseudouridine(1915)-N(3))-methyltransferase RlmH, partial [Acidobacteriaceae bacterium]|nr:23S rRNA (pseudouridine(1915)-N(3))-methyltransferase RlmH [Acidobacteriaceae bacterium]